MSPEEPRFPLRQGGIVLAIEREATLVGPIPDEGEIGTMILETEGPSAKSPRVVRAIDVSFEEASALTQYLNGKQEERLMIENPQPIEDVANDIIASELPQVPANEQDTSPAVIQGREQHPSRYKIVGYVYNGETITHLTKPQASIKLIGFSERGKEIRSAQSVKKRKFIHPTDYRPYQPAKNEDLTQQRVQDDKQPSVQADWSVNEKPKERREPDPSERIDPNHVAKEEEEISFYPPQNNQT